MALPVISGRLLSLLQQVRSDGQGLHRVAIEPDPAQLERTYWQTSREMLQLTLRRRRGDGAT
jgi:hypothetical protein